jgi:hypothetical protein
VLVVFIDSLTTVSKQAHVMAVDYPGYGYSDGRPSEGGAYDAARSLLIHIHDTMKIPPNRVILYAGFIPWFPSRLKVPG